LQVGFGVEEVGEAAAEGGGLGEEFGVGRERDPRPVAEESPGVSVRYSGVCMIAKAWKKRFVCCSCSG